MKLRFVSRLVLSTALVVLLIAGCGGEGEGGGEVSPAAVAPPGTPILLDFPLRLKGEVNEDFEAAVLAIGGIPDPTERIIWGFEEAVAETGGVLYLEGLLPLLAGRGGLFLGRYAGEDFEGFGAAFETKDDDAAREFIETQLGLQDPAPQEDSYEGVDFEVLADSGTAIGVFDGLVVLAEDEAIFKSMVDASDGENLAGEEAYTNAAARAPSGSILDVYVDVGALVEETGGEIDPKTRLLLDAVGLEPEGATAFASLIPRDEAVEVAVSTDLAGDDPFSGDDSGLLASLPNDLTLALASAEFGQRLKEGIDRIDAQGIPGELPPNQLKKTLRGAGLDLDAIADSIDRGVVFAEGSDKSSLRGGLVLVMESADQARNTVSSIGRALRSADVPGVTAVSGRAKGFAIRSPELGRRPVVVAARGSRVVIGHGLRATLAGLSASKARIGSPERVYTYPVRHYKYARRSFDGAPITAFLDAWEGLKVASSLIPPGDENFEAVKRYLNQTTYFAVNAEASDGLTKLRLMIGY